MASSVKIKDLVLICSRIEGNHALIFMRDTASHRDTKVRETAAEVFEDSTFDQTDIERCLVVFDAVFLYSL